MPSQAVQQLLEQAQRSGLFSAAEGQDLIGQASADKELTTDEVAAQLVERKLVTAFQAEQLLAGRGDQCIVGSRYRILEKLGAGGMGTVYKAQDTKLDRLVALKVLPPHLVNDPGAVARFQREAKALAKVSHPAIVQAHDTGEDRGQQFLVMEYMEGTNLGQVVKKRGRIPPTLAADYIYQVAQGLQHAHDKGLVHRDLKPSNLLLTPDRQIKILDLGLARFLQDQLGEAGLTREGTGLGTPDYMAPEQFGDARHVDCRADIYALGCTLYHLLTGKVPFAGSSLTEKAKAHEQQEPPPVEERCPEVPAGLVLVTQRMMAKRPANRFQTAGEVAEALAPYIASSAGSLPQLRRTTSWHGSQPSFTVPRGPRHRPRLRWALVGVATVILLALAIYFGSGLFLGPESTSGNGSASPAQPQVVTIPNGFTVAKDGTGQFITINDALERVDRPGMTIRVLDDATYSESLRIVKNPLYAGLTLESPRRATIALPPEARVGVLIGDIPNVELRSFRVRLEKPSDFGVIVNGRSSHVLLVALECVDEAAIPGQNAVGIHFEGLSLTDEDEPVIVQACKVTGVPIGIAVHGLDHDGPLLCRRVIIRDSEISKTDVGILLDGWVSNVQITGNRVWDFRSGIHFHELRKGSTSILVANNSLKNPLRCLAVDQAADGLQGIEVRNNLFLAERGPDLAFTGNDQGVLAGWKVEQNWRLLQPPAGARDWIPAAKDWVRPVIGLPLDPASPDFLRPAKDSPLATEGAGKDDPTLPVYVGAVPPEGVALWDWRKTWDARQKRASPK